MAERRESGWLPVTDIETQGYPDIVEALAGALAHQGRVDRATHGFHTWPAGLHPDAVRELLALQPGPVHDPFTGGGTVLVEAVLDGRRATGTELSPVGALVARCRATVRTPQEITTFRSAARRITEAARAHREPPTDPRIRSLNAWYDRHVACELEGLRQGILGVDEAQRELLWFTFSSLLVKVSLRQSDTSRKRVEQRRPHGTTAILFHKKARELGRRLEALAELAPADTPLAEVRQANALRQRIPPGTALVLTSPPYPAVYDYLPAQDLRMPWLGLNDDEARRNELGSRRAFRADHGAALKGWREGLRLWTRQVGEGLEADGALIVVIGDGIANDQSVDSIGPLIDAARDVGLLPVGRATGKRRDHGLGRVRKEHVVMFRRA